MKEKLVIAASSICLLVSTATASLAQNHLLNDHYDKIRLNKEEYENKQTREIIFAGKKLYQLMIKGTVLENYDFFVNGTVISLGEYSTVGFGELNGNFFFGLKTPINLFN